MTDSSIDSGHDLAKRSNMTLERAASGVGEAHMDPASPIRQRAFDSDVVGAFQRRELLGQGRVGKSQRVADEREVDPVGGS